MIEIEDVYDLIDSYCDSCPHNGNCPQDGCERKSNYADRLKSEYLGQFIEECDY